MSRRPQSVLILVYRRDATTLLLKRRKPAVFWQSITGALEAGESHADAAHRELFEETGIVAADQLKYTGISRRFTIDARWRHRYADDVFENDEFEWHYEFPVAAPSEIDISREEHSKYCWLPVADAAEKVWSWTNRDALLTLATGLSGK